jgi:ribosome maturation factor RimP
MQDLSEQVKVKVEEVLNQQGLELVEFRLIYAGRDKIVRCMVDHPTGGIVIDECAVINRQVFKFLEESNILGQDFSVEVHSPGLDRLFSNPKDFRKVCGKNIMIWLNSLQDGKDFWEGRLEAVSDKGIRLEIKEKLVEFDFNNIKKGKEKVEL